MEHQQLVAHDFRRLLIAANDMTRELSRQQVRQDSPLHLRILAGKNRLDHLD
jgi:hypothetical protein